MTEQELLKALRDRGPQAHDGTSHPPQDSTPASEEPTPADTNNFQNPDGTTEEVTTEGSSEGGSAGSSEGSATAAGKGKKRTGRHSSRHRMKITDSRWEQAFLIAYLPQFAKARRESFFAEEVDRVGNYVAVRGDQSQLMRAIVDARKIEAWAMMNSAQASLLVPHVSFAKVATPAQMELFPDSPQRIPITFDHGLSLEAIMDGGFTIRGARATGGAGIKDVTIKRGWGKTGPMTKPRITVDVNFTFDSVQTFAKNQRSGMSFLDLIPTGAAKVKTKGKRDTLWNLQLTYGWEEPLDSSGEIFSGPTGRRILGEISRTKTTLLLMYGGDHDITIQDDGSVELKITYLTTGEVEQGDEPALRSNVLNYLTHGGFVSDYEDKRATFVEQLEKVDKEARQTEADLAGTERMMKDAEREIEEFYKQQTQFAKDAQMGITQEVADMNGMTLGELRASIRGNSPAAAMDQSVKGFIADIDLLADDPSSAPEPYDPDKYADYLKTHQEKQSKLKQARTEHQSTLEHHRTKYIQQQKTISDIHENIRNLEENHQRMKEKKYSSLVEQLFRSERLYALDLTPKDISSHSGRDRGRAYNGFKKFRDEKIMDMLTAGVTSDPLVPLPTKKDQVDAYIRELWEATMGEDMTQASAAMRNKSSAAAKKGITNAGIRNKRIYYFYLGDLLDIIMTNYYAYAATEMGGDDESQWGSRFQTVSLMLGDFNYNTYKNDMKPRKNPEEHVLSEAIHMGDFPIALSSFLGWFAERFIRIGTPTISLESFLSDLATTFFGQDVFMDVPKNNWGPMLNPRLPQQRWDMRFNELVSTVKLKRGWEQRIEVGEFYDVETHPAFKLDALSPPSNTDRSYSYLTLGPGFENNMSEPAFTIYMGAQTSFIKQVKYNKQKGNKRSRTRKIEKAGKGQGNIKFMPSSTYTVDLETFGAPFMIPGLTFELNNNVFGMSTLTADGESLTDILPRILRVNEVVHKITPNNFESSIKCKAAGVSIREFIDNKGDVKGSFGLNRPGVKVK